MRHHVFPARAPAELQTEVEFDMIVISCYAEDRKRKDYYDSLEQMD